MTYAQIARKDFEDAIRSRMVWGLIAAFVGFMAFVLIVALARRIRPRQRAVLPSG